MFLKAFRLFILSFYLTTQGFALDNVIYQYAGDIGKHSIGTEFKFKFWYGMSVHYGIVPANEFQNKIETYTLKNNFYLFHYGYKNISYELYSGIGLFHVPGNKYKTHEEAGVHNNYYRQSSIRGMLYIGHQFNYKKHSSIYLESGINDIWIINSYNNDSIDYRDHVTLGVGYKFYF